MSYAITTPAGGLFRIVRTDMPAGKTAAELGVLDVDPTIPDGFVQDFAQGPATARGWQIVAGVCRPILTPFVPSEASVYSGKLAEGFADSMTGLKLKTSENAQSKFTSQVTLLQVALSAGAVNASTSVAFWDYTDQPQTLALPDFMGLMLRYGLHCQQLFADYAT